MASPDHVQQKLRGVVEATQHTHFRPTVKGPGHPTFRSKAVRDLSAILDLNRSVLTWSCNPPPLTVGGRDHAPDLRMQDTDGGLWMLDAFDRKLPAEAVVIAEAAAQLSYRYRVIDRSEIYDGFRLRNAVDLLRYAGHNVPLGDRVRLLAALDENGSLSFADCLRVIRETQPIAALASLILQELVEVELDEALIGPETMVRRIRA
jgi:hypothetical protein